MNKKSIALWTGSIVVVMVLGGLIWQLNPEGVAATQLSVKQQQIQKPSLSAVSTQQPVLASTTQQTVTAQQDTKRLNELQQKMLLDVRCVQDAQNTCGLRIDPNDPKAAYFEVINRLQAAFKEVAQIGQRNPQLAEKVQDIARNYVLFDDTQVQEIALDILQQYPPSAETFDILKRAVLHSDNSHETMYSMQSLARYNSTQEVAQITPVFIELIQHGAFESADRVAYEIYPFINSNNVGQYESLLQRLDPDMERSRRLSDTLQKWKAEHQGAPINHNKG